MSIHLSWDDDKQTVLLCSFDHDWTWDEADTIMNEVKRRTDSAPHEIAAIIDLSNGVHIPGSIFNPNTMNHAKKMLQMGETESGRRGPVIVVSTSSLIRTIYNTVRGMDKEGLSNVSFASTLDEARAALTKNFHPST